MQMVTSMRDCGRPASAKALADTDGRIGMSMMENGRLGGCMGRALSNGTQVCCRSSTIALML